MGRQFFASKAVKTTPNTSSFYFNHAQKQHVALKSKCDKEKEHDIDWSDPRARAWMLGPMSCKCLYWAMFDAQYDWVMRVKQERANKHERARSLFGKHYIGLPGWDKPEFVVRSSVCSAKEVKSAALEAKAVVPKPALAILKSNLKPVQPAADSSTMDAVDIGTIMEVPQQAATQLSEVLPASDIIISNNTHQQACSSGMDSTPDVLPISDITRPENTTSSTEGIITTFVSRMQGYLNRFLAFELKFDVTIGYWS